MALIKLSIALFLLRIAVRKPYIWILRISMVVVFIWSVAIFFFDVFQCAPVEAQWDFTIADKKCLPGSSFVAAAYSISVMTIVTDWLYAILPVPMIWSVQMTVQAKATVAFVLSLGVLYVKPLLNDSFLSFVHHEANMQSISASIATLIRLKYLIELADIDDVLCTFPLLSNSDSNNTNPSS